MYYREAFIREMTFSKNWKETHFFLEMGKLQRDIQVSTLK